MSERSNYVALLFAFLLSSSESETANITTLISKSPSPSYAVEGKNFTFVWTYSLDGTIGSAQYTIERDSGRDVLIGRRFSPGTVTVEAGFEARFRARATETRAELTILAVQRSDQQKYKLTVLPTGAGSIIEPLLLVVNFPANITEISANQSVIEGGNITLRCLADGKPTPNITWTRHPDDCVVDMTLTDIRRKHAGKYRCTAYNGIGRPTSEDVVVDVQYPTEATGFGENATVAQGGNKTLSCPVDGNPKPNITWYRGSEISETLIFIGEKWIARDIGCYTCVASNSLGTPISITQCLAFEESSTPSTAPTPSTVPTSAPKGPSRIVIGVVIVVAVFVVIVIGLVAWWMWKKGKCRKHTKNGERHYVEVAK